MKRTLCSFLSATLLLVICGAALAETVPSGHRPLYQGHGSLRIVTADEKVIYIDPYAGEGYDLLSVRSKIYARDNYGWGSVMKTVRNAIEA